MFSTFLYIERDSPPPQPLVFLPLFSALGGGLIGGHLAASLLKAANDGERANEESNDEMASTRTLSALFCPENAREWLWSRRCLVCAAASFPFQYSSSVPPAHWSDRLAISSSSFMRLELEALLVDGPVGRVVSAVVVVVAVYHHHHCTEKESTTLHRHHHHLYFHL